MTPTFVLIDHPVGQRDDRASRMLVERGFAIEWYCPGKGDSLPTPQTYHAGAIVYGGTENLSVDEGRPYIKQEIDWIARWVGQDRPLLGICLGSQLMARALDAPVAPHPDGLHEIGYYPIVPTADGSGFLPGPMHVYHWHMEGFDLPQGATLLASGETFPNQAFRYGDKAFGLQFHPEVSPPVMQRWLRSAGPVGDRPGAHPDERQIADAARFDDAMRAWLESFFDRWLAVPVAAQ